MVHALFLHDVRGSASAAAAHRGVVHDDGGWGGSRGALLGQKHGQLGLLRARRRACYQGPGPGAQNTLTDAAACCCCIIIICCIIWEATNTSTRRRGATRGHAPSCLDPLQADSRPGWRPQPRLGTRNAEDREEGSQSWRTCPARRQPAQARPRNAQRDQRMGKAGVPCASRGRLQVRLRATGADQVGHEQRTRGQDGWLGERHSHMRKEQRVALVYFGGNYRSSHTCLTGVAGGGGRRAHARRMTGLKPPRSAARHVARPHSSARKTTTPREARRGKREACRMGACPSLSRRPPCP